MRGFEPRDRGDAAITFIRFAQKRFAFGVRGSNGQNREKKNRPRKAVCFSFGAPAGIRTPDTLLKRQVLCLLSYWGAGARTSHSAILTLWLGWRDSNPLYRSQSPVCYHYTTSQYTGRPNRGFLLKQAGTAGLLLACGVGYGARTHDTRNHNPVLCQLS